MPRPKETYDQHRCLSARSNREASESQPPSPPGSSLGPGHFIQIALDGSVRRPVLLCGRLKKSGRRLRAVSGKLVLGGAKNRTRILDLEERNQTIAAHGLEVLKRQPERHSLAFPYADR